MSAFNPPPVGQHPHVVDPPDRRAGFTRAHCRKCGYSLEHLLNIQTYCEIEQPVVPVFSTSWRISRASDLVRS